MAVLGECVLGSEVAEILGTEVGGTVISSPESVFDLAGTYPLKMEVVGVLAPSFTADDEAGVLPAASKLTLYFTESDTARSTTRTAEQLALMPQDLIHVRGLDIVLATPGKTE